MKGLACHGHAAMGNTPWTRMTMTLCMDQYREFTSTSLGKYCDELGVQWHLATPYSPQ